MSKRLLVLSASILLLTNCSPALASTSPTQPITDSATQTLLPSETPSPIQTSIPTATPYAALQTDGPYLLYTYDNRNFIIMDADGSGRKQFRLPNDGYIFQLKESISPDGKRLAYFTGSIETPYDVALNLFNLSDETTTSISNLLAPGFPTNLDPIIETMVLEDSPNYDVECFEDMECRRSLVERELTNSLFSFHWSPGSETIAFVAQIDDPSSDIYMYSIGDGTIRRLTREPQNIYWMDWAPNAKSILFEISSTLGTGYEGRTLHITDLEGRVIDIKQEILYSKRWGEDGWITENLYLFYHPNDTDPPIYDLMTLNTDTGQLKVIWPHSADSFAVNRENNTILLLYRKHRNQSSALPEGVYVVSPSGDYQKVSDGWFTLIEGQKPYPILARDYEGRNYTISNNGSVDALPSDHDTFPSTSPDGKFRLFSENNQLALYTQSYQPINTWEIDVSGIIWRPDSLGVFVIMNEDLYYLSIPDGTPVVVDPTFRDECPVQECRTQFVWLP